MTLVVLLLLGGGAVYILSAMETDPNTGKSLAITTTISQIWNDQITAPEVGGTKASDTSTTGATQAASSRASDTATGAGPGRTLVARPVGLVGDGATAAYLAAHRGF